MTRKTYVLWGEVLQDIEEVGEEISRLCRLEETTVIDRSHPVAERIRQLGRDMEPPTGPVKKEE